MEKPGSKQSWNSTVLEDLKSQKKIFVLQIFDFPAKIIVNFTYEKFKPSGLFKLISQKVSKKKKVRHGKWNKSGNLKSRLLKKTTYVKPVSVDSTGTDAV